MIHEARKLRIDLMIIPTSTSRTNRQDAQRRRSGTVVELPERTKRQGAAQLHPDPVAEVNSS